MKEASKAEFIDMDDLDMSRKDLDAYLGKCCESKADEFRMLGYEHVTGEEVWDCVVERYARKDKPRLHQAVNDILSLKTTQFMNWMTLSVFKGKQL